MSTAAVQGEAEAHFAHLSCAQPTLIQTLVSDMAEMKRNMALLGERETFFLFRLCEQATYIIRAQDTVTALLQVQTIKGVGQLGGLNEL